MRALLVALLWLVASAGAFAQDDDPLEGARDLLGGPENERAVAMLRKVIAEGEAAQGDAKKQQRAGRAHFLLEEDAKAVAALERAAALAPKEAGHPYWLGVVWSYSDGDKAAAALERAVTLDPKHAKAWLELGKVRARKDQDGKALEAFLKAAAIQPEDADTRYQAGTALQGAGRSAEATLHFKKAVALDPKHVDAGYNLGLLEYRAGRFAQARDAWLAIEPHAAGDMQLRAKIVQAYFALEKYDEAKPWREKVRQLHAQAEDEETRAKKDFCIDQFAVDDLRVLAYEQFDRSEKARTLYVFRVTKDGTITRRINLEPSPVGKELGGPAFMLGADEGDAHTTFNRGWKEEPAYPELKAAVIDAIRGKLDGISSNRR